MTPISAAEEQRRLPVAESSCSAMRSPAAVPSAKVKRIVSQ